MGKSKKKNKINTNYGFSQGLEEQIVEGRVAKIKKKKNNIQLRADSDEEESYIDSKTSQRILKAAQKQRAELASEFGPTPGEAHSRGLLSSKKAAATTVQGSDDSDDDNDAGAGDKDEYTEHDFYDDLKINADDERALEMFQNK